MNKKIDSTSNGRARKGGEDACKVINKKLKEEDDAWDEGARIVEHELGCSMATLVNPFQPRLGDIERSFKPKNPDYSEDEVSLPFSNELLDERNTRALKMQSYKGLIDLYNHLDGFIYTTDRPYLCEIGFR